MKNIIAMAAVVASLSAAPPVSSHTQDRPAPVVLEAVVDATPSETWNALTTQEGVTTFFSEHALVESEVGGAYEMYFFANAPEGSRGGEGITILAMEPNERFLITWNAPPQFGEQRFQHTVVEFLLKPAGDDDTLVRVTHGQFGFGPDWAKVRAYFSEGWKVILGRMQYRFDNGPIDWSQRPDGATYYTPAE